MSIARPRVAAAALAAATVLASTVTVLLPAPAHAATTGSVASGTATWGISRYVNSPNPGRPNPLASAYAAPSTFDAASQLSTWGAGTGLVAPDGSADLAFDGTSVNFAPTGGGWLRLTDLEADLDAAGNGPVSAVVSYGTSVTGTPGNLTYDPAQAPTRAPERVTLVTLAGNTAADRVVTATAATWTGLDGTWSPAFLDYLDGDAAATPAIAGWSYAATITNNVNNPANGTPYNPSRTAEPFTFSVATVVPTVTAAVTGGSYSQGLSVGVAGDGFRGVTNTGDAGVYIGIAPSGGLPDVTTMAGMDSFAIADYRPAAALATGAFTSTLVAPTDRLDPTKTYSVYTWQAHTHSNTSQDTETPLTIDFSTLAQQPSTTTAAGATAKAYGATSTLGAAVSGPGTVTLTGVGPAQTKDVTGTTAVFTVPATLPVGSYTAVLVYSGGGDFGPSETTRALTVTKAASKTVLTITKKPTAGPKGGAGKARIVVTGPAAVAKPAGKVTVKLTKPGGKARTVTGTLANGVVTVTIPQLGKGAWTAVATYAGNASFTTAKQTRRFTVR